jgi:hypothetical protein
MHHSVVAQSPSTLQPPDGMQVPATLQVPERQTVFWLVVVHGPVPLA